MKQFKATERVYLFKEEKLILDQMAKREYTIPAAIIRKLLAKELAQK